MAEFVYKIAFRDSVDNQYITSSTIVPYYPPSATSLNTTIENNTFFLKEDEKNFVGYDAKPSIIDSYTLPDGQIVNIKQLGPKSYIEVSIPQGLQNPTNPTQNGPYKWSTKGIKGTLSEDNIVSYINTQEGRLDYGSTWTKFKASDLKPISASAKPASYGFRIQTPGYEELRFFSETGVQSLEGVVDLGIKVLKRIQTNKQKEITSFQEVDSTAINQNSPTKEQAKGLDRLSQTLQKKSINLKTTLVTGLVSQITQFGINNIKELIEGKIDENKQKIPIDKLLEKLPKLCPSRAKIQQLITIRNRYTDQINAFFNNVQRLSTGLTGTERVSEAISTAITTTSSVRKAANAALAFVPVTPGAAPSSINILKDIEDVIKPKLDKILSTVGVLLSTIAFVAAILNIILQLLKILDKLLLLCSEKQGIPFSQLNALLNSTNDDLISNLQNSTPNIDNTYRGFKFEIVLDVASNTKYPKRYVVGKDKYGVILLKSESSFAPDPRVLIDELKFIIDRDNLSAE